MEDLGSSVSAINVLGDLLRLTEVFLWDDAKIRIERKLSSPQISKFLYDDDLEEEEKDFSNPESPRYDDMELSKKLSKLGLPISFQTNKGKRSGLNAGIRNFLSRTTHDISITQRKSAGENGHEEEEEAGDYLCPVSVETRLNTDVVETSDLDSSATTTTITAVYHAKTEESGCEDSSLTYDTRVNERSWGNSVSLSCPADSNSSTEVVNQDALKEKALEVYWDSHYQRHYYYNCETQESTWAVEASAVLSNVAMGDDESESARTDISEFSESAAVLSVLPESGDRWKKKRRTKTKSKRLRHKLSRENSDRGSLIENGRCAAQIEKYWCQRYHLFSKFEDGIKLDEEGWFSVTPELIARHHAKCCPDGVIIDCFAGVGGNAIQFALRGQHVIAIDIDPRKIAFARHNASVYGVGDRIDFVTGDTFMIAPQLKADAVFLSPPWGGPEYVKLTTYTLDMLLPRDGFSLFKALQGIAPVVVMFLPRTIDLLQLAQLAMLSDPPFSLQVEKNFLNGRLKAITAYFTRQAASLL